MPGKVNYTERVFLLGRSEDRRLQLSNITDLKHLLDNDTNDVSQPRQTSPRVSFTAGKTKFKQWSFPDRQRVFLSETFCLVTVLLWHSKTSVI